MQNLLGALETFNQGKIIVIGDIILDKFSWGKIDSLNPEMPAAPKVKISPTPTYALGGAANVANNLVSLNANCSLYGVIGNDENGKIIVDLCNERGIDIKKIFNGQPTIMKERVIAHGQQVARLEYGEWNLQKIKQDLQKEIQDSLKKDFEESDLIILSDYNKTLFSKDFAREIINLANSKNIPVLVDPKPMNIDYFKNCYAISPNEKEAEEITGVKYNNGNDILGKMGKILSEKLNSRYSIITCGKDGVFGYDRETKKSYMIKTKAREVNDVSGAGDTFISILALGLTSELDIFDSIRLANYGAGIVVEKVGTATTNIDEIKRRIELEKTLKTQDYL